MRRVALGLVLALAAASPALGHSASRGLHIHVEPERAAPGAKISVRVHAAAPLTHLTLGFVDEEPTVFSFEEALRTVTVPLRAPESDEEIVVLQAEGVTRDGKTLRSSSLLRLVHRAKE